MDASLPLIIPVSLLVSYCCPEPNINLKNVRNVKKAAKDTRRVNDY